MDPVEFFSLVKLIMVFLFHFVIEIFIVFYSYLLSNLFASLTLYIYTILNLLFYVPRSISVVLV